MDNSKNYYDSGNNNEPKTILLRSKKNATIKTYKPKILINDKLTTQKFRSNASYRKSQCSALSNNTDVTTRSLPIIINYSKSKFMARVPELITLLVNFK